MKEKQFDNKSESNFQFINEFKEVELHTMLTY